MIQVLKVIVGALIVSVQQIKRHPWVVVVCVVAILAAGAHSPAGASNNQGRCTEDMACWNCATMGNKHCGGALGTLQGRLTRLEHACIPRATGGGVTQCVQVSVEDEAWRACLTNTAYVGVTMEDTLSLLRQCLNDWRDAHPHIHP